MKNIKTYIAVSFFSMVTLTSAYALDVHSSDSNSASVQEVIAATNDRVNSNVPSTISSEITTLDTNVSPSLQIISPTGINKTTTLSNPPVKNPSTINTLNPKNSPLTFAEEEDNHDDDFKHNNEDEDDEEDDD